MTRVELGSGLIQPTLPMSDVSHSILHYGLYNYRTAANQWNFREYFLLKKKKGTKIGQH